MGKHTTTKSTSSPPAFAVPIISGGANDVLNNYNANQGNLQGLTNSLTGSTIPQLQNQIQQTNQNLQPGFNYLNNTLGSGFLNNGQSQAQALGQFAGQQAGNAINSSFSAAGRTGSGNNITDTARGVTQATLAPMLQNLQYNEGVQSNAAGMLPGYTNAQYAGYQPLLGATQEAAQLPYYGTQSLGTIGGLLGNYGTTTTQQPSNLLGGILGAGLSGWASGGFATPSFLSDRRLKTNLEKVGQAKDGLGIYTWNWRSDPKGEKVKGVIADEVERLRPWAHVPNFVGQYAGVNYGALGSME